MLTGKYRVTHQLKIFQGRGEGKKMEGRERGGGDSSGRKGKLTLWREGCMNAIKEGRVVI